jgi:hypothetical protein
MDGCGFARLRIARMPPFLGFVCEQLKYVRVFVTGGGISPPPGSRQPVWLG